MRKNGCFDQRKWNATLCCSGEEIEAFMDENDIYGKTIRKVNVIGMAKNMERSARQFRLRNELTKAGVSYDPAGPEKYADVKLPWEISVCEPVVIVFEDNTTLEMQMRRDGAVKLAINKTPADAVDGTNFSNLDGEKLFACLKGKELRGISLIDCKIESQKDSPTFFGRRHLRKLQLDIYGEYGLYFEKDIDSWYRVGIGEKSSETAYGWKMAQIPYAELESAAIEKKQIEIVEGHDHTSYFWIMPVKAISKDYRWDVKVEEYGAEQISIEEDAVGSLLYFFLKQVYDPSIQEPFRDTETYGLGFVWNLEFNVFTYDSVRKMIATIREYKDLLQTDYDDPKLDELKKGFRADRFEERYYYLENPDEKAIIRENIYVATEFYERFCNRMEIMMENAPQFELISFMGP